MKKILNSEDIQEQTVSFLKSVDVLFTLSGAQFTELYRNGEKKQLFPPQKIAETGQPANSFLLILEGAVGVFNTEAQKAHLNLIKLPTEHTEELDEEQFGQKLLPIYAGRLV